MSENDDPARLARAIEAIDAINATDPRTADGTTRPKELVAAERVTAWLERIAPGASEALRLAARGHHLRRWAIPRAQYPEGRAGYHAWRRALADQHAAELRALLGGLGYPDETLDRVEALVRKQRLGSDPETQALEDAICLTFLELEFRALADRLEPDHMVDVLRRTLRKMGEAGKREALGIPLGARERDLLERALAG